MPASPMRWWIWAAGLAALATIVPRVRAEAPGTQPPVIQALSNGWFRCGAVRFNRDEIRFPAVVNMTSGLLEYAVVSDGGKMHESLFLSEIEPYALHLAVLFTMPTNVPGTNAQQFLLKVQPVAPAGARAVPMETLIRNKRTGRAMEPGPWVYTGSRFVEGEFIAQRERSLVAIYDDPDALLNHRRAGHDDDEIWYAHDRKVPAEGTRVEVIMTRVPVKSELRRSKSETRSPKP